MGSDDQYSVERMADRMAIQDTMYRWCRSIDRLDSDGMRAVFHPDAIDDHGSYSGGVEGLVAWVESRHKGISFSSHQVSNMLIEFAGPDLALVETCIRAIQRYPAESRERLAHLVDSQSASAVTGLDLLTSGRYVDRFERRGGEWRIFRRTVIHDWNRVMETTEVVSQDVPGWVGGHRDQQDFIFQERAALGISS